jgi:hypothetical protein
MPAAIQILDHYHYDNSLDSTAINNMELYPGLSGHAGF